jgi:acetyl-CoA carboxylase biotin carboxyl carrier protein
MTFELSDVKKVLDAFRDGEWDRIHLRDDDSELFLSIVDEGPVDAVPAPAAARSTPATAQPVAAAPMATAQPAELAVPAEPVSGLIDVCANSMGIFWRSPSPGAPPFVNVGDAVTEDSTVCIVEVMKLMHRTTAAATGVVHEVLVENGVPVAAGQPLFRLAPATA